MLLTGATGFVGKQVLKALLLQMEEVTLVVRTGGEKKIPKKIKTVYETADLFSEPVEWWINVCKDIDIIIHLAWYAEPGKYLLSEKNIECLQGTLTIAKAAVASSVKRFVGIGTCFEYDLTSGVLSTDTSLMPTTPYAAAKAATFLALSQYLPNQNMEFLWCRLFYLYGEGEDERRLVPYIRTKLEKNQIAELTSGNQIRDFMNVTIAGQNIVDYAFGTIQGAINVCTGVPVTVRQLAEKIADDCGSSRELLQFGVRPDNLVDPPCVVGVKSARDKDDIKTNTN